MSLEEDHIHSYKAIRGQPDMYMCTNPDCTHTTPPGQIEGKRALCAECFAPFIISGEQLRKKRKKLKCTACSKAFGGKAPRNKPPELDLGQIQKDLEKLG